MLKITGYSDRLYGRPGDTIEFKVNCQAGPEYDVEIVGIICGDTNPNGPGIKEVVIDTPVNGRYKGRPQYIQSGSFVEIQNTALLEQLTSFSVDAFIWPTTPHKGEQGIITKWSPETETGFALMIDDQGSVALRIGAGSGSVETFPVGRALQARRWYRVGASVDAATGVVQVFQTAIQPVPGINDSGQAGRPLSTQIKHAQSPLYFASFTGLNPGAIKGPVGVFNGKIDSPRILARAMTRAECASVGSVAIPPDDPAVVGAWDFSDGMNTCNRN